MLQKHRKGLEERLQSSEILQHDLELTIKNTINTDFLSNQAFACNVGFEVHVSVFCLQCITVSAKGSLIVIVINIIITLVDGGVVVVEFIVIIVVFNITVSQYCYHCQYVSAYTDRELLTCYTYSEFCIQARPSLFIIMS